MEEDAFQMNIDGVGNLIESGINKVNENQGLEEGIDGDYIDSLELDMEDKDLISLRDEWLSKDATYTPKIKPRQDKNKLYYVGMQRSASTQTNNVVSSNLIFEAEETFIPQALSKNPEPVVFSDNTEEGKQASNEVKTMLQYHADVLCLRKKLGVQVRHWSIYLTGILKHGWDSKMKDINTDIRKPQNFVWDPDAYIDEYGNYVGEFLGEKIDSSALDLINLFPDSRDYIFIKVNGKLGTKVVRTEWWTDEYCFTTFEDEVLDKHKNEFFNYPDTKSDSATPQINHFSNPKMPYTFLSVFSLQETPHDITNLIEQNIPNQDRINNTDDQIARNLRNGNNSIALSGLAFTSETAHEAAMALEDGDPVLVPDGNVSDAIKRFPANDIPSAVFTSQENDKITLRSVFGTQGLTSQPANENTTARGQILNQSHDSSRIGGGIGDALEQVADNVFNWWLQLYCVFYDEEHYAAVMGSGQAVEYISLSNADLTRKFVVSVAPNSMQPKDEITEQNMAIELYQQKALDPITLFKRLNYPDPMATAKQVALWITNPQAYMQLYFPENAPPQQQPGTPVGQNPQPEQGSPPQTLAQGPASPALNQVPINTQSLPK